MTVNYRTDVESFGPGGYFNLQGSGTYVIDSIFDPGLVGSSPLDSAGAHNPYTLGATPTFQGNLSGTAGNDDFNVTLQALFISSGVQDRNYTEDPDIATSQGLVYVNDNSVPATWYFNLFGRFYLGENEQYEIFGAINNLLDQDPRFTPYYILTSPVNGQYYDKIGRRFTIGARVRF
jgi:outer membrane receptor protein involved in Fe transport